MWRNRQWHFPRISGFSVVDFRLTSYLRLTGVLYFFVNWVLLVFLVFLQHTTIFFLFWGMFFTLETETFATLLCIRLSVTVISFRGGCRTLPTYDVVHCVCENLRYWEWFWIICTWKFIVDVSFLYWYAANTEKKCYKMFITFEPSFDLLNLV